MSGDALQDLVRRRADDLRQEALAGGLDADAVQELERLELLANIHHRTRDAEPVPSPRRRLYLAGLTAGVLAVLSLLLFGEIRSAEIELDVRVSEAALKLQHRQEITTDLKPRMLGLTGLREIQLPRARGRDAEIIPLANAGVARLVDDGEESGFLTLAPVVLAAGGRLRLLTFGEAEATRLRLALASDGLELRLTVQGVTRLEIPGKEPILLELPSPRVIHLIPGDGEVELDLAFIEPPSELFIPHLQVTDLDFTRVDEARLAEGTLLRRTSTMLDGSLYFLALDDVERKLRRREMLTLRQASGWLRSLDFEHGGLGLNFLGTVHGMSTGSEDNRRSLMPSILQWLHKRQGLALIWGLMLSALAISEVVLILWRKM